jgi:hypothetical protein
MLLGIGRQDIERGDADVVTFFGRGSHDKSPKAAACFQLQNLSRLKNLHEAVQRQSSFEIRFAKLPILFAQTGQIADAKNAFLPFGICSMGQSAVSGNQDFLGLVFHFTDNSYRS